MDGGVLVDGQKVTKPGTPIKPDSVIELVGQWQEKNTKYVSRGGLKLERALQEFRYDPSGKICLDLGASTGGFTDCLLQHGAAKVYAIDVGYGQIDWKLRQDPRVIVIERTNVRNLSPEQLYKNPEHTKASLAVADLSFISLTKIIPNALQLLHPDEAHIIALIKPQFEAGRDLVGKGGVVRAKETHEKVLNDVIQFCFQHQLALEAVTYSPVKGPAGNIEFLALWRRVPDDAHQFSVPDLVSEIVDAAHAELNK